MADAVAALPTDIVKGGVVWLDLDPVRGREQRGHRPVLVVSSQGYLEAVTSLAIVIPVTSRNRGWPNHVKLTGRTGLMEDSWAITEQPRTIARERISRMVGAVDDACLAEVRLYLRDYLGF